MVKLSRSKIERFIECPRCFWFEMHGKKRPPGFPFTINNAIDFLLKREFDECRLNNLEHYLIKKYKIDARPFNCEEIDRWRTNFTGVQYEDYENDFLVFGAVDDVWINSKEQLIVVDYKATGAKQHKIWDSYKRQMEIYQWLLRKEGHKVSRMGYFLFAKVNKDQGFEKGKLHFDLMIEPCTGTTTWIETTIKKARKVYDQKKPPKAADECEYCQYVRNVT